MEHDHKFNVGDWVRLIRPGVAGGPLGTVTGEIEAHFPSRSLSVDVLFDNRSTPLRVTHESFGRLAVVPPGEAAYVGDFAKIRDGMGVCERRVIAVDRCDPVAPIRVAAPDGSGLFGTWVDFENILGLRRAAPITSAGATVGSILKAVEALSGVDGAAHYIVVSSDGAAAKPRRHASRVIARREAERLSKTTPGVSFTVYRAVGVAKTAAPVAPVTTFEEF